MKKTIFITILIIACILLPGCGKKSSANNSAEQTIDLPKECKLSIEDSGWTYSEDDDSFYYAIILKNESKNYVCTEPCVELVLKDGNEEKLGSEYINLPQVQPGETVAYSSIISFDELYPRILEFKLKQVDAWRKYSKINASKPLVIENAGTRIYSDKNDNWDDDDTEIDTELEDFDKLFDELDEDFDGQIEAEAKKDKSTYSNDSDLYKGAETREYYGTIVNENDYAYEEVLVCVLFRDGAGNLIGGENYTVRDVGQGRTEFSFVSASALTASSYEYYAYAW